MKIFKHKVLTLSSLKAHVLCIFVFIGITNSSSMATNADFYSSSFNLTGGHNFSCLIDDNGVHCWGRNKTGQTDVPQLKNPKMIAGGLFRACAIDDNRVNCWGNYARGSSQPRFKNPKIIVAGRAHFCAIDDNGVQCWGDNEYGQIDVPHLKNPKMVTTRYERTCALDDIGVQCWGEGEGEGEQAVVKLKNPKMIAAGYSHTCAIDDNGVQCWGHNANGELNVPKLKNPKMIAAGNFHTCAIEDHGVQCWGNNKYGQTDVPKLKNPKMIAAGNYHTCAIDDNGAHCWGANDYGQTDVPREFKNSLWLTLKELNDSDSLYSSLSQFVYNFDRDFLLQVEHLQPKTTPLNTTAFIELLMAPYILGLDYPVLDDFKEIFSGHVKATFERLGVSSINDLSYQKVYISTAVQVLMVSIKTMIRLVPLRDKVALTNLLGQLAELGSGPKSVSAREIVNIQDKISQINITQVLSKHLDNPYLASRTKMQLNILAYLENL